MSKKYKIHFICHGNTFRSRLAAAYFAKIIDDDRYEISSSGTVADQANSEVIEPFTATVAHKHDLDFELQKQHTQTTQALLAAADLLIFMKSDVYNEARQNFGFDERKAICWHISDVGDYLKTEALPTDNEAGLQTAAESIFNKIKAKCDELKAYATRGSWVDVVDKNDKPTGLRLPISMCSERGLWHRGVRAIVQSADGKFVVEKRSEKIIYSPGMLEIGFGGLVDAGEPPLTSARRELFEELGISAATRDFRPLFKYRITSYHPHYKTRTRTHIYVYAVTIPSSNTRLKLQEDEVQDAYWLSGLQIRRLIRGHRLKHFGRLAWEYKLFRLAVAASQLP